MSHATNSSRLFDAINVEDQQKKQGQRRERTKLDLPNELIVLILEQFDNVDTDELHSPMRHKTSPIHFHFRRNFLYDCRLERIIDRLIGQIFPRIHHRVPSLTVSIDLIDRVLRDHCPNLIDIVQLLSSHAVASSDR